MIDFEIGKGKFGFVFLAKQALVQDGQQPLFVAIKYIPKQVIFDTDSKARLQQVHYLLCIA
jgi:hypothetical protein